MPVLHDPLGAGCVIAGRLGASACWQVSSARGRVVARAVGAPFGSPRVPERMLARHDRYHQEWIGSGHGVNGWVDADRLEALVRGRETLVVVAEVAGAAVRDYYAGRALLERSFFGHVAELSGADRFWLPTCLPDGVIRMSGRLHDWAPGSLGDAPEYVAYADAQGRTLRVQHHPGPPDQGESIDINGLAGRVIREGERIGVWAAGPWHVSLGADGEGFAAETLRRVVASIPALQPASTAPRSGTGDARHLLDASIRRLLGGLGATWIRRVKAPPVALNVFMYMFRTPTGARARATIHGRDQPTPLPALGVTRTLTVEGVDLLVRDADEARRGPEQAYGVCNGVFLNIVEPMALVAGEAAQLAASLVEAVIDASVS